MFLYLHWIVNTKVEIISMVEWGVVEKTRDEFLHEKLFVAKRKAWELFSWSDYGF